MVRERLRTFLGFWAPFLIAVLLVGVAVNFYLFANLGDLEGWRGFCAAGVIFVGALLMVSSYGRLRKARAARKSTPPR